MSGSWQRPTPPALPAAGADWVFTLAVAAVALVPRLFVAIAWPREPVWDGHYYHYGAERIAAGHGYTQQLLVGGEELVRPWSHYPVGYSGLLGSVYAIFGSHLLVAPLLNAVLGTLMVLALHRLARFHLGENRARVAAGLAALHPGLIAYSALVMTELLAGLLLVLALWTAMARGRSTWGWAAAGLLLGLAALVRPASILAAPLLALTDRGLGWHALRRAALASTLALAIVLPWSARNCVTMDGCAFISTNGGWNLAIGALSPSGRFHPLKATDGCPLVAGQVQQDRCWAGVARRAIMADPWGWLARAPRKLGHTYNHESFPIDYLHQANPTAWPEARRQAAHQLLTWFHRLLLLAAALGVVALPPRAPPRSTFAQVAVAVLLVLVFLWAAFDQTLHPFWLLPALAPMLALLHLPGRPIQGPVGRFGLGLLAATSLTHVLFFGEDRYHMVLVPFLCLLAASALRQPQERAAVLG